MIYYIIGDDIVARVDFDDKEDLEIKSIAESKDSHVIIIGMLLFLSFVLLSISTVAFFKIYVTQDVNRISDIKNKNGYIVGLINEGKIEETITKDTKGKIIDTRISEVLVKTKNEQKLKVNLIYQIITNDFNSTNKPTLLSPLLVRFAYSYDKENWKYLNNVINTVDSNISPLTSNYYDISGYTGYIKALEDYEIDNNEHIYFKSETTFNPQAKVTKNINYLANFYIEIHK